MQLGGVAVAGGLPAPPLGAWLAARAMITQFRFSRRLAGTLRHSIQQAHNGI